MKKNLFLLLVCMACASVSFAQIKIDENTLNIGIGTSTPDPFYKTTMDGDLLMRFANSMWAGGMSITQWSSTFPEEFVDLSPAVGLHPYIQHSLGKRNQFHGIWGFNGDFNALTAYNFYNYSDKTFKRNINSLSFDRNAFDKLRPVSYEISNAAMLKTKNTEEKGEDPVYTPQYGFIAQELQKIYPQLVLKDDETGYLKTKPVEMIPILVAAIQDKQKQIDELKQLVGVKGALRSSEEIGDVTGISFETITNKATLYQNVPNPFNQSTEIRYYIPENSQSVQLCIYNLQGNQIKRIVLTKWGEGSYLLSASELTAGMYLYTLIIDGKEIDTKRMILTE